MEAIGGEWRGVEGSGGDWRGVEGSGGGVEGSEGDQRVEKWSRGVEATYKRGNIEDCPQTDFTSIVSLTIEMDAFKE